MQEVEYFENIESLINGTAAICLDNNLLGSGTIVSSVGLVVTCYHVIKDLRRGDLSVKVGGGMIRAEVYKKDKHNDLAVLKLTDRRNLPNLKIEKDFQFKEGHGIFAAGYSKETDRDCSESRKPRVSKGIISRIISTGDEDEGIVYFESNVYIDKGYSGGPVINSNGYLIGFLTTRIEPGMACCIPFNTFLKLVSQSDLEPDTSIISHYAEKLSDYYKKSGWKPKFASYIDLNCRLKNGEIRDLMTYVREEWLKDESKTTLAILGEFGSGKTLFGNYLSYRLAKDYRAGEKIPVFINLGLLKRYDITKLKTLMIEQMRAMFDLPLLSDSRFSEILESGELIPIFDGFEEMSMKASRYQMADNFKEILESIAPGVKFIISCRTHYFSPEEERILEKTKKADEIEDILTEATNPDSLDVLYIEPFDHDEIRAYLKIKEHEEFYQKIINPSYYDLIDLAKRPIFLYIIVETLMESDFFGEIRTGTELYTDYVKRCFRFEAERRKTGLAPNEQSNIIEEIAFEFYQGQYSYLDRKLLDLIWKKMSLDDLNIDAEDFMRKYPFFRRFESQDRKENRLEFIHQSFLEFFVAMRISRSIQNYEHRYYAAEYLASPIDKYLFQMLKKSNKTEILLKWLLSSHPDINLRMNCAITLGRSKEEEFIPGLQKCLEIEKEKGDIGVAGRISEALYNLGDKDSLADFLKNLDVFKDRTGVTGKVAEHRLLYDIIGPLEGIGPEILQILNDNLYHPNHRIRKYSIFILGRTGSTSCADGLIKCLTDPQETIRTRRYAAAALGLLKCQKASPLLKDLAAGTDNEHLKTDCLKSLRQIGDTQDPRPL